ncbi:MAG: hypothetical protein M5U34_37185 [Chloroflexi bacterium]|nr:hypothetical protein [Chloroflexota bacterium]
MNWQQYDLVFRLLTPMHIGWRKTSNLQQTRGYVTGKIFWAALTARLTREAEQGANGKAYIATGNLVQDNFRATGNLVQDNFRATGNLVQDNFRFTYLYPATQNGNGYKTHYPWEDDFDYLFLDSYTSAALNYDNQSTEDGLLHETEFIAPHTRRNQPVYLCGSIYVKETAVTTDNTLKNWQTALDKLQFGGERGYGWGRIKVIRCHKKAKIKSDKVQVEIVSKGHITAHLETENSSNISGAIEPLIGWERNNNENAKSNWKLSKKAEICYAPGAISYEKSTFTIGNNGLWQQVQLS